MLETYRLELQTPVLMHKNLPEACCRGEAVCCNLDQEEICCRSERTHRQLITDEPVAELKKEPVEASSRRLQENHISL